MVLNPPYRPQANGVVERSQGVAKQWAEPWACATAEELQQRLDEMDHRQRDEYPSGPGGQPRSQAHAGLAHSGRACTAAGEPLIWDIDKLKNYLVEYMIGREVDSQGKISVYNTQRFVGREFSGRWVWVQFDPVDVRWVVMDEAGLELRRVEAPEVCPEAVMGLRMMYRLPCRPAPCAAPVGRAEDAPALTYEI
jgi:hypothetical protein